MEFLLGIFRNPFFIVSVSSWFAAQFLKTVIHAIENKKLDWSRLVGDGGMPSGHSSIVTALAVSIGLFKGFDTAEFAIAFIFAAVVMRDAMGVRLETGKQAASIIKIADLLNDYFTEYDDKIRTDKLKVLVGHTPLQVVCGSILGAVVSIIFYIVYLSLI
jgi:acid phosphatase family membrane protein YuiD